MLARLAAALLGACLAPAASAAVFCAHNPGEIVSALALVQGAPVGSGNELRIGVGQHVPALADAFSVTVGYYAQFRGALQISGGWTDAQCTQQVDDPNATILFGVPDRTVMQFFVPPMVGAPLLSIRNLRISGGADPTPAQACGALFSHGPQQFRLERTIVSDFSCGVSHTVVSLANNDNQSVVVSNNLFAFNVAGTPGFGMLAEAALPAAPVALVDNTLAFNHATSQFGTAVLYVGGPSSTVVDNNLFWDNAYDAVNNPNGYEVRIVSPLLSVRNNAWALPHPAYAGNGNLFGVDPQFGSDTEFSLRRSSPLRNAGTADTIGGVTAADLAGLARVQEGKPDIGAYEVDIAFASGFE